MSPYVMPGMKGAKVPIQLIRPLKISSINEIMNIVGEECDTDIIQMRGKRRDRYIVEARQILSYIMVKRVKATLEYVGHNMLGGRDHTTVLHSVKKYEALYDTDEFFRDKADRIISKLGV